MKEIIISQLIDLVASFVVGYIALKLLFKDSILLRIGLYVIMNVVIVAFVSEYEAKGYLNPAISFVVSASLTVFNLWLIAKSLKKPLNDSIDLIEEIGKGNLNINVRESEEKNELGRINNSLSKLVDVLKPFIKEINDNSTRLLTASKELIQSSEDLSSGANEQAASVEEVSSTMEEMASNIESNTDNAQQTEKIAFGSAERAKMVGEAAQNSLTSVNNIANKINVINDIAFQTNLLALNAAVEAARAGEHGKGFAVVAAEVRKLAENSKVAAEEIVKLADESVKHTEMSSQLVGKIIPQIEKTTTLVQEIASASMEQNNGASQVNNAILQLNEVAQRNAAASEELSANASELDAQAQRLKDVIGYFSV